MTVYRVVHSTEYRYDEPVSTSYGRTHLRPRDTDEQSCAASTLVIAPEPIEQREHVDFFGNTSAYFVVRSSHERLRVESHSEVDVRRKAIALHELDDRSWEHARLGDRSLVLPSPLVAASPEVAEYASDTFATGRPLGTALGELVHRIYADFDYDTETTTVRTTLPEVLKARAGVCQDFAHLAVGCLRSVGLSARYVSGYLETSPPPGKPKLQGADASHAWASVLVPGHGWVDLDPTNNTVVDERYIVTAWGRDYSDVPPLKGVIVTDAKTSTMTVSVDVTRQPDGVGSG